MRDEYKVLNVGGDDVSKKEKIVDVNGNVFNFF